MMCGRHLVAFVLHRSMMSHHGGKILFDMNGPLCYNPRHLNRIHPPDEGAQMARMPCAQWGKTGESPALARNGNLSSTDRKPELPPSSFGMTTPRGTGGPCVRRYFHDHCPRQCLAGFLLVIFDVNSGLGSRAPLFLIFTIFPCSYVTISLHSSHTIALSPTHYEHTIHHSPYYFHRCRTWRP